MLIEIYDNGVLQYIMKEYGVHVYKKQVLAGDHLLLWDIELNK
jgi:hypothetical protein